MDFLYNEKDVNFNILCSCSHCLMITFSKKICDNNQFIESDTMNGDLVYECNNDNNNNTNQQELFILQKKDNIYKDFVNFKISTEYLTSIKKMLEKTSCNNKNRCCRYYELLICESLKSLKDIEINSIINDINNTTENSNLRRSRRTRSRDMNLSRTLDYRKRLEINHQYQCIEQCFETLIILISTLIKWKWINDLYLKIYHLLEQSKIYEIMGKLCDIPLLEITCNPSLYRNLFKLYKYFILYGFVQPWEKHQELADYAHKLISAAREFLNMVEPVAENNITEDGLISVSQFIVNEWDNQCF
ncbi:hypothetical protein BCR32DRAFT_279133 [Anaeromyces robustus]|uniref:Uncharacterized protein n=1 Tax=Anaeromyces robustus TaxID=1754192 RepID=A0A1Y1X8Y5_9FUNG|nr:hypothetical protein BCR32DRAFT_279133 [Anaeromyces robustus]|eukprot:ORX82192.1 hypothetical protein BCR32DRAFT_279133 [Anaeromyces robustus]